MLILVVMVMDRLEELEDLLDDRLLNLNDVEKAELLQNIIINVVYLSEIKFDESVEAYLLAQNKAEVSDDVIQNLRSSLSEKIKSSVKPERDLSLGPFEHWIYRLIYLLVSEEKHLVSDQVELIMNAIDFCNIPPDRVSEIIHKTYE